MTDLCRGGDIEWRNPWHGDRIDRIRVCEAGKGCSAWEKLIHRWPARDAAGRLPL